MIKLNPFQKYLIREISKLNHQFRPVTRMTLKTTLMIDNKKLGGGIRSLILNGALKSNKKTSKITCYHAMVKPSGEPLIQTNQIERDGQLITICPKRYAYGYGLNLADGGRNHG